MLSRKGRLFLIILLLLISGSFYRFSDRLALAPQEVPAPQKEGEMRVHFLDVGQGDSILIELPNAQRMLIDGGTRSAGDSVLGYLQTLGIDTLDYLIATHPHEDHIGGLIRVVEDIPLGKVYMPKVVHTSKTFENFVEAVVGKGHKFQRARAGVVMVDDKDLRVDMLAPVGENYDNLNNYSAVVKLEYKNIGIILMGDAETDSEQEIDSARVRAQVLKAGHHGSRTSTSPGFLESVSPTYAVISCGEDNDYGHPHPETLERLDSARVSVLRTDQLGTVVLTTDGREIVFTGID